MESALNGTHLCLSMRWTRKRRTCWRWYQLMICSTALNKGKFVGGIVRWWG
jgi:hypothetical protein